MFDIKVEILVMDEPTGNIYQFTNVADISKQLDITPEELVYGLCMPNGYLVADRYIFHKYYMGDLAVLNKDIVMINEKGQPMMLPNVRVASLITGIDMTSIVFSLDIDSDLDLPFKFYSLEKYTRMLKDMLRPRISSRLALRKMVDNLKEHAKQLPETNVNLDLNYLEKLVKVVDDIGNSPVVKNKKPSAPIIPLDPDSDIPF